ncbi:MAG: hypothetical protein ACJ0UT_03610 [Candidatus Latescibacterota bacterium]
MAVKGKKVAILGCTGSIGDSCFKVLENLGGEYEILALSGRSKDRKACRTCVALAAEDGLRFGSGNRCSCPWTTT